ncbi:HDOD domain-containing protein [Oxalobacteraceae bacterium OM1]|nr:HDOD domain-containing protein [Oxalobacteraceae bacterium OM1]
MLGWLRTLFADTPPAAPAVRSPAAETEQDVVVADPAPAAPDMRRRRFGNDTLTPMQRNKIDFLFASWLFDVEDHSDVFTNPTENAILAALDELVASEKAGAHLVRRMPGVIPALLQNLRSPDFSGSEIAKTISNDLVLVTEVLRLANSVAFSRGKSVSSIDHAVLVLGQNGLRQLITSVAFRPVVSIKSGSFTRRLAPRLWLQSERCALASRALAQEQAIDALDAFLAGLIQNIGLTVSLRVIDQMSEGQQPVGSPTFCNALATYGRSLACNIASEWSFPESVITAIRQQETFEKDPALSAVGRILLMGDYLSKMDILMRYGQISAEDIDVTDGLGPNEMACLKELAATELEDWDSRMGVR